MKALDGAGKPVEDDEGAGLGIDEQHRNSRRHIETVPRDCPLGRTTARTQTAREWAGGDITVTRPEIVVHHFSMGANPADKCECE